MENLVTFLNGKYRNIIAITLMVIPFIIAIIAARAMNSGRRKGK